MRQRPVRHAARDLTTSDGSAPVPGIAASDAGPLALHAAAGREPCLLAAPTCASAQPAYLQGQENSVHAAPLAQAASAQAPLRGRTS